MTGIRENPPDFLRTDEELNYYHQLHDDLVQNRTALQYKDRHSLGMLAANMAIIDLCNDSLTTDGLTITYQGDRKEITKANPAMGLMDKAQISVRHYLREFGMSPNSRTSSISLPSGSESATGKMDKFRKG